MFFSLYLPQHENMALQVDTFDESYIWHLRYSHLNHKGLQLLNQKDIAIGLPYIDINIQVYEGCIYGKMYRLSFPKTS